MNTILRWLLALAIGMLLSFSDYDAGACSEYFTITSTEIDQDGNTLFQIVVTEFARENASDSVCESFGRCVYELIASAAQMGAVEIVNPPDEWVPSQWRWIGVHQAELLAGLDPEEVMISQYGYTQTERTD